MTTQFRVRRGSERGGAAASEDDEKVIKPDLVLFVNGIPLVVMEAKSPTLMEVWKTKAVKQLHHYQETGPEWHGAGAPALFDTNLMCVDHCGAGAALAALGARENAYAGWKLIEPLTDAGFERRYGEPPRARRGSSAACSTLACCSRSCATSLFSSRSAGGSSRSCRATSSEHLVGQLWLDILARDADADARVAIETRSRRPTSHTLASSAPARQAATPPLPCG